MPIAVEPCWQSVNHHYLERWATTAWDGGDETRELGTLAELVAALDAEFGIRVPASERLRERLRAGCGFAA